MRLWPAVWCAWGVLSALGAPAVESPFADRPCRSYASSNDAAGRPVDLRWGDAPLTDFGSRAIEFDQRGVRPLRAAPAPGVHPRIYCTPDDRADVRRRLRETRCGQAAWKNLLCWTEMLKGRYDDTADYARPDTWKGSFGGLHGRVPLFRLGAPREPGQPNYNHSAAAARLYAALADGSAQECPPYYWGVFALEAFRCWVEDDAPAARTLAAVVLGAMRLEQAKRPAGVPDQPVGGFQLAFVYDFAFDFLTADQRQALHDELAAGSWHHDNYGTFNEATGSRSNWATFSYWLFPVLAIEGEPGFNDLKVRGIYRGWRNLFTYGWFASGATYEGEAKNQLGLDGLLALARRTQAYGFDNLVGHPYVRAYATNFLPHSVIPTQDGFLKYDLLGGAHGRPMAPDTLGLKYLLPDDRVVDWVYRSAVGQDYEHVPDRCDGYRNDLLFCLLFASDFDPANDEAGKLGLGHTFCCGERALLLTRSSWQRDALLLGLHTRQANGGHAFADRNAIQLCGAGRVWSPPGYASFKTYENSVVCIDGQSQSLLVPGRLVGYADAPLATFAVGDAKYCWDWNWQVASRRGGVYQLADVQAGRVEVPPGWQPEVHTTNDFSYTKLPFAYLDAPLLAAPHWLLPRGSVSPVVRAPAFGVQRAFRTAGLVRGPRPYALVLDDLQKDATVHHYDWLLTLEPDIKLTRTERHDGQLDLTLRGDASPAELLVRVLAAEGLGEPRIDSLPNASDPQKYGPVRRLVIPADAVAPDFKVLLYPHQPGAPLPTTTWDAARTAVAVDFPDQSDRLGFARAASGKTNLRISRGEAVLAVVDQPVEPLRDVLLEQEAARVAQLRRELADFRPEALPGRVALPAEYGQPLRFTGAKEGRALPVDLRALGRFTFVCWARPTTPAGFFVNNSQNRGFALSIENRGFLRTDGLGQHRWLGNTPLNFDAPHHFAVTHDGQTLTIYVDGRRLKSEACAGRFNLAAQTVLGGGYTGVLDHLGVYNRALEPDELARLCHYQAYVEPQPGEPSRK